jgi:hypothetical protein
MNLEDTIKRNNTLMQNLADSMHDMTENKKKEEILKSGKSHVLEDIKSELNTHYNNVSDAITKLVQSNKKIASENDLSMINQKIDVIINNTNALQNSDHQKYNIHKKEYILFGKDASLTTKHFLLMVSVLFFIFLSFKYLPSFFDYYSDIKSERDSYKTFYRYHYLRSIKVKDNEAIEIMENQLELIQKKDSVFMKEYNAMESWLQKDLKVKSLKNQLKEIEQ